VEDFPDDDPQVLADLEVFETCDIRVRLDGVTLMEGTGDDLKRFLVGPVYFDEPILYDEPQPRPPDVHSDSAIWFEGFGFVYPPLAVGRHTLVVETRVPGLGYGTRNSWDITVTP
jgi:hypothetical protein